MSSRQQDLENARRALAAAADKRLSLEAKQRLQTNAAIPNLDEIGHIAHEITDSKRVEDAARAEVGELELGGPIDKKNPTEMLVWMTQTSPTSPAKQRELAEWQRREDFLTANSSSISKLFSGPDYYNQGEVEILDMILVEDAKSVGDGPSNFTNEELSHMAAKAQSGDPELILGQPTQKLLDTKRVLVDSYAAIKFGEKYDPATLDKIIQDYASVKGKDGKPLYSFVQEAEDYYAKHNMKLLENGDLVVCAGDKCELRKFHTYTKDDLIRQLHVMKEVDPKVKKELTDYRLLNGLNPETGERLNNHNITDAKTTKFGSIGIAHHAKPDSADLQIAAINSEDKPKTATLSLPQIDLTKPEEKTPAPASIVAPKAEETKTAETLGTLFQKQAREKAEAAKNPSNDTARVFAFYSRDVERPYILNRDSAVFDKSRANEVLRQYGKDGKDGGFYAVGGAVSPTAINSSPDQSKSTNNPEKPVQVSSADQVNGIKPTSDRFNTTAPSQPAAVMAP